MTIGRVLGLLLLVFVLYAVISQPVSSASMARTGMGYLSDAGSGMSTFMSALFGGDGSGASGTTTTSQVQGVPAGGAATGDGSTGGG